MAEVTDFEIDCRVFARSFKRSEKVRVEVDGLDLGEFPGVSVGVVKYAGRIFVRWDVKVRPDIPQDQIKNVVAFDGATGQELWRVGAPPPRRPQPDWDIGSIGIDEELGLYVIVDGTSYYRLNPETGELTYAYYLK